MQYIKEKPLELDGNPTLWGKKYLMDWLEISMHIRYYTKLSIPAERCFSSADNTVTARTACVSTDSVNILLSTTFSVAIWVEQVTVHGNCFLT